jgi:transcription elongation GreA/GreB family factor
MYHSSKTARDRDRLREGVLRGLGWELHRIWGTDWYRDRVGTEARLRAAVERAIFRANVERTVDRIGDSPRTEPRAAADEAGIFPEASGHTDVPLPRMQPDIIQGNRPSPQRSPSAATTVTRTGGRTQAASAQTFPLAALANSSHQRVRRELAQLEEHLMRPQNADPRETDDNRRKREKRREQLEARAASLRGFLQLVPPAGRTIGGPLVAPGRLVGLIFDGAAAVEEYEITSQTPSSPDTQVLSPFTELGTALLWREAGTRVEYTDGLGSGRHVRIRHVRD